MCIVPLHIRPVQNPVGGICDKEYLAIEYIVSDIPYPKLTRAFVPADPAAIKSAMNNVKRNAIRVRTRDEVCN